MEKLEIDLSQKEQKELESVADLYGMSVPEMISHLNDMVMELIRNDIESITKH